MELLKNVQIGLLVAYLGRVLVLGANLSEMGIIFSLVALNISKDYLEKQKRIKDIEQEVNTRVAEVENTIKIQNEVIEKMARALDEQRTSVASLKLSQGLVKRA
jgi:uncharacterized coiled-coil protein SlyX